MSKKLFYNAPVAEPLVVQAEGVVCTSGNAFSGSGIESGVLDDLGTLGGAPLIF